MNCIVLARDEMSGRRCQYALEDQGESWWCTPAVRAEQAWPLLPGTEVLLVQPCREARLLLDALGERPPLAPPYVLGLGMDAPDGCLPDLSALPVLLRTCCREGRLPILAGRHLPATREIAAALLHTMAVPQRLRAWEFLPDMIALTVVHPPLLYDLCHGLYPLIAGRYGMTASAVERSLRLCVESTWTHGSLAALERFFGSSVDPERGKPTNREFLCRVQERLTLTMGRLV